MKKILWLSHEQDLGGANKCLAEQIKILSEAGYDISVIVMREEAFADAVRKYVSNVYQVYFYSWVLDIGKKNPLSVLLKRMMRNMLAVFQIMKIIWRTKPDFVVTNTVSIPVAAFAAKLSFKKHIWFIHEFGEEDHGYQVFWGFKKTVKLINWLSYKIAFNSEAVRKKYVPYIPIEKQFIAHNPVVIKDIDRYVISNELSNDHTHTIQCIILGQVAPSKNQLEALKAIKNLRDKGVKVLLNIVGGVVNADYHKSLLQFIKTEGLSDIVKFSGYSTSPFLLLEKTDLLLMCSRMEAFGRVTVEALKLGVPVVAANSGGSPEIIDDGINGYLYTAGSAESLTDAIQKFIDSHQLFDRKKIAEDARKKFNAANAQKQLASIFT